jgi:hypothetical protein
MDGVTSGERRQQGRKKGKQENGMRSNRLSYITAIGKDRKREKEVDGEGKVG